MSDDLVNTDSKTVEHGGSRAEFEPARVEDGDFTVECSDDEKYEITPEVMVVIYNRIANGDMELCHKLVRIRSPTPEVTEQQTIEISQKEEEAVEDISGEKTTAMEFDFDICNESSKVVTPRRTIGSTKTPRAVQKRVARWDKIMNDCRKHQKLEEDERFELSKKSSSTNLDAVAVSVTVSSLNSTPENFTTASPPLAVAATPAEPSSLGELVVNVDVGNTAEANYVTDAEN